MNYHQIIKHHKLEIDTQYAQVKNIESCFIGGAFSNYILKIWSAEINLDSLNNGIISTKKLLKTCPSEPKLTPQNKFFFTQNINHVLSS